MAKFSLTMGIFTTCVFVASWVTLVVTAPNSADWHEGIFLLVGMLGSVAVAACGLMIGASALAFESGRRRLALMAIGVNLLPIASMGAMVLWGG